MRMITLHDLILRLRRKYGISEGQALKKIADEMDLSIPTIYRYTKMEPPVLVHVDKVNQKITIYKECGSCNSTL